MGKHECEKISGELAACTVLFFVTAGLLSCCLGMFVVLCVCVCVCVCVADSDSFGTDRDPKRNVDRSSCFSFLFSLDFCIEL